MAALPPAQSAYVSPICAHLRIVRLILGFRICARHLRITASQGCGGFSTLRYLNPPAIPFSGFNSARKGLGFQELGNGES